MTQTTDANALSLQIKQLFDLLCEFEINLKQESTILKNSNLNDLNEALQKKQSLADSIDASYQQLSPLLSTDKKLSLNEFMLLDLFKSLPKALQDSFNTTAEKIVICSDLNMANGMATQSLSNINQSVLHLLQGQDPQNKTYSATGESKVTSNSSRPLGKA